MLSDFRRLGFLVSFLKEIVFDNAHESDLKSSRFNPRKFTVFVVTLLLLATTCYFINRTYDLAQTVRDLNHSVVNLTKELEDLRSANLPQTVPFDVATDKQEH